MVLWSLKLVSFSLLFGRRTKKIIKFFLHLNVLKCLICIFFFFSLLTCLHKRKRTSDFCFIRHNPASYACFKSTVFDQNVPVESHRLARVKPNSFESFILCSNEHKRLNLKLNLAYQIAYLWHMGNAIS